MSWWFCRRPARSTSSGYSGVQAGHLTNTWTDPLHSSHLTHTEPWWTHLKKTNRTISRKLRNIWGIVDLFPRVSLGQIQQGKGNCDSTFFLSCLWFEVVLLSWATVRQRKNMMPERQETEFDIVLEFLVGRTTNKKKKHFKTDHSLVWPETKN